VTRSYTLRKIHDPTNGKSIYNARCEGYQGTTLSQLVYSDSDGTATFTTLSDTDPVDVKISYGQNCYWVRDIFQSGVFATTSLNRNAIINGGMGVAQRGTTFTAATVPLNSDDTYLLDRWILLSDGNDIVDVSQVTTPVPTGAYAAACFDIETEDKKWGWLTILEAKDSARFIGGTVSLSFKAARGASDTSTLLRAGILSWSSTADTVTSDIVNAWGNEGTNPTLVANWTFENTPAALADLTDAYQTYKIEGISIDTASTTNIAVFIWSDDKTNAVGDLVYITDVQLELGSVSTPFEFRHHGQELALCKRYFYKLNSSATAGYVYGISFAIDATATTLIQPHPVGMRTIPTLENYAIGIGNFYLNNAAAYVAVTALAIYNTDATMMGIYIAGAVTAGLPYMLYDDEGGATWIAFNAEL
jgi:hypothetical protein